MWPRFRKHLVSIGLGQAINLVQQLLLPAAFLRGYGVDDYGAWLVVLAAGGQLGNLDLGLQTFTANRLTMLHEAGKVSEFRRTQSIALRLTLALCGGALALLLCVPALPIERWLRVGWAAGETRAAVALLGAWVILRILQGQLSVVLRATGSPQRAQHWDNFQRVLLLVSTLALINIHTGFLTLAVAHVAVALVALVAILIDARRAPIPPTLAEWNWPEARAMISPSLFFALTPLNFLVLYEAPLLILQWTAGPLAVVTFATTRTLFSAARQLLTPIQLAVQPELTRAFASSDRSQIGAMYRLSESIALIGGTALATGVALASPWLISRWLHGTTAPENSLLALMAAVCVATIFKDNKFALPLATNRHERATLLISRGYLVMCVVGFGLAFAWQSTGLLIAWLVVELALGLALLRQNHRQLESENAASPIAPVALAIGVGIGSFAALNSLANAEPLTRLAAASAGALLAGLIAALASREALTRPARRWIGSFQLCRQEG